MNLFLLTAVPLAAVVLHRLLYPSRAAFADPRAWILGSVWSLVALVVAAFFGRWRTFAGDLVWTFAGLTVTDVLLVPGLVVGAWLLTRPRTDAWELSLWLALAFTMAGIRDFASTNATYDLNELFLVPLGRILVTLALPTAILGSLRAAATGPKVLWAALAGAVVLTGSLFPMLSFAGWGWTVWIVELAGIAGVVLWAKKRPLPAEAAPQDNPA